MPFVRVRRLWPFDRVAAYSAATIGPTKACRVHRFGPPEVITLEDMCVPPPGAGEVLVSVKAADVGPWDRLVREGRLERCAYESMPQRIVKPPDFA